MGLKQKLGKSVSWRIHGTATTLLVSYLVTGSMRAAGGIAGAGIVAKLFIYMYHEKLWEVLEARGYSL